MKARTLSGQPISFGFLMWWTIAQGIYDRDPLVASATALPQEIQDALTGAREKHAWERATYLKIGSIPSIEGNGCSVHYTTRDIEESNTRLLIREVVDNANVKLETTQVARLIFNGTFVFEYELGYYDHMAEVDHIILRLQDNYNQRVGRIDDNKVRNALLGWMDKRHRITVRGSGGVYYIPTTPSSPNWTTIASEINVVRNWLSINGLGTFTSIELVETKETTKPDFLEMAIAEVIDAMDTIDRKLKEYTDSTGMNDGSRMEASRSQVNKIQELQAKIEALEDALGDKLMPIKARAMVIGRKAENMHKRSSVLVTQYRAAKGKVK
jgi:hypothetical protein